MSTKAHQNLMFVVSDGIKNSVFISQVLQPLLEKLDQQTNLHITLVSFERTKPTNQELIAILPAHDRLHCIIARRLPFIGKIGLYVETYQLNQLLKQVQPDTIIARGPLAGFVVQHTIKKIILYFKKHGRKPPIIPHITIQARGLCAEEYRYDRSFRKKTFIGSMISALIYQKLTTIEQLVFGKHKELPTMNIEAVSPALKEYLVNRFQANPENITLAAKDVPKIIERPIVNAWRKDIRDKLNIPHDALVYCYSGSFKPWQCAPQIIEFFTQCLHTNSKSFLLILSADNAAFVRALYKAAVSQHHFVVKAVSPTDLYRYLAAADYGLLFRERDIINWVSRPTKMLEYKAVGLPVLHNNTIELLEREGQVQK